VLFQTNLCSVEKSADDEVSALIVSNKAGLTALSAKVYIDCTGDADLSAWAGAEFHQGNETGETQATTHCFTLANVDSYAYRHSPDSAGGIRAAPSTRSWPPENILKSPTSTSATISSARHGRFQRRPHLGRDNTAPCRSRVRS